MIFNLSGNKKPTIKRAFFGDTRLIKTTTMDEVLVEGKGVAVIGYDNATSNGSGSLSVTVDNGTRFSHHLNSNYVNYPLFMEFKENIKIQPQVNTDVKFWMLVQLITNDSDLIEIAPVSAVGMVYNEPVLFTGSGYIDISTQSQYNTLTFEIDNSGVKSMFISSYTVRFYFTEFVKLISTNNGVARYVLHLYESK